MEGWLARLGRWVSARRKVVAAAWLVLVLVSAAFASKEADHLSGGGWSVPGSESARAADQLKTFPGAAGAILGVLVTGQSPQDVKARLAQTTAILAKHKDIRPGAPTPAPDGNAALVPLAFTGPEGNQNDVAKTLRGDLVQTTSTTQTRVP